MERNEKNIPTPIMEEDDIIDLGALFLYLLQHWYWLVLCFVIGAMAMGYLAFRRPYTYTSSASIFIQSDTTSITSLADVQLGTALSGDFIELATCKPVLDTAIGYVEEETGVTLTREEIKGAVSIHNTEDTRLLVFKATTADPLLSKSIAQAMANATAEQVSAIMKADEPTKVDLAEIELPNGKGMKKKALVGGMAGAMIPAAILVLLFLLNDMVYTDEDVRRYLDTNVIASISLDKSITYKKGKKAKKSKKKAEK